MRYFLLFALAVAFGVLMWGRRDQSDLMVGTWDGVGTPYPARFVFKDDSTFVMSTSNGFQSGELKGEYKLKGSSFAGYCTDGWEMYSEVEWHGDDGFTLHDKDGTKLKFERAGSAE